jgi:hypothetical protein
MLSIIDKQLAIQRWFAHLTFTSNGSWADYNTADSDQLDLASYRYALVWRCDWWIFFLAWIGLGLGLRLRLRIRVMIATHSCSSMMVYWVVFYGLPIEYQKEKCKRSITHFFHHVVLSLSISLSHSPLSISIYLSLSLYLAFYLSYYLSICLSIY